MEKEDHINRGSSLEDFLIEEGILDTATDKAINRVIDWQNKDSDIAIDA